MKAKYYQIDAFTSRLFSGNPAGVCLLDEWMDDSRLQAVAAENNLSETAFLVSSGENYKIRWFTPEVEVDLCGHATLASAYVIFNYVDPSCDHVVFESMSGLLKAGRDGDMVAMDFPAHEPEPSSAPDNLRHAMGVVPREVLRARDYLVVYDSEEQIKSLRPDMERLKALDSLGIIVTAPGRDCDFVSRFFAPGVGIPEDPVTGSAHCALIPYWAAKTAKSKFYARQLSQRGGELFCELTGDRVLIAGRAVTYLEGVIYIK